MIDNIKAILYTLSTNPGYRHILKLQRTSVITNISSNRARASILVYPLCYKIDIKSYLYWYFFIPPL